MSIRSRSSSSGIRSSEAPRKSEVDSPTTPAGTSNVRRASQIVRAYELLGASLRGKLSRFALREPVHSRETWRWSEVAMVRARILERQHAPTMPRATDRASELCAPIGHAPASSCYLSNSPRGRSPASSPSIIPSSCRRSAQCPPRRRRECDGRRRPDDSAANRSYTAS